MLTLFHFTTIRSQPWCHSLVQSLGTALFGAVQPQGPPSSMHAHSAVVKLQRRLLAASFIAHTGMPCVAFGGSKRGTARHCVESPPSLVLAPSPQRTSL